MYSAFLRSQRVDPMPVHRQEQLREPEAVVLALEPVALRDLLVRPMLRPVDDRGRQLDERDGQDHADHERRREERPPVSRGEESQDRSDGDEQDRERRVVERSGRHGHQRRQPGSRQPHTSAAVEHRQREVRPDRDDVVRRQEQVHLSAHEVVRRERVEQRDHDCDLRPHGEPPKHEVGHDGRHREGEDEEDVHHERRVVGEQAGDPEEQDVQRVSAQHRVVVELLALRSAEPRVLVEPAALHHALDQRQVERPVAGVGERDPEVRIPEPQEDRRADAGEDGRGRRVGRLPPGAQMPSLPSTGSDGPQRSSSRDRSRCRIPHSRSPASSSKRPSSNQVREFSGWSSTARM